MKFPPHADWFSVAYQSLRGHFNRVGESDLIKSIEKDILDPTKNGGFMMGLVALGLSTSTNSLESQNRQFASRILDSIQRVEPRAKLPTSIVHSLLAITSLWPEFSDPNKFSVLWQHPKDDLRSQSQFLQCLKQGTNIHFMTITP